MGRYHPLLEKKAGIITSYYRRLLKPEVTKKSYTWQWSQVCS